MSESGLVEKQYICHENTSGVGCLGRSTQWYLQNEPNLATNLGISKDQLQVNANCPACVDTTKKFGQCGTLPYEKTITCTAGKPFTYNYRNGICGYTCLGEPSDQPYDPSTKPPATPEFVDKILHKYGIHYYWWYGLIAAVVTLALLFAFKKMRKRGLPKVPKVP